VHDPALSDGVVRLREWDLSDAEWYATTAAHDELIQRFTSESPTVTSDDVRTAILDLRRSDAAAGFLICDAATGARLGNIALHHEDGVGHVSRVAERVGFRRDPRRDEQRNVKDLMWTTTAYRLPPCTTGD
jgi:RimJ/RimL family protein N-acetyltransferase